MAFRKNDPKVILAMAKAANLPPNAFEVEFDDQGAYILNHPESQKWSTEKRKAVKAAAEALLGARAFLM